MAKCPRCGETVYACMCTRPERDKWIAWDMRHDVRELDPWNVDENGYAPGTPQCPCCMDQCGHTAKEGYPSGRCINCVEPNVPPLEFASGTYGRLDLCRECSETLLELGVCIPWERNERL